MQTVENSESFTFLEHVLRVTVCLNYQGVTSVHTAKHHVFSATSKRLDIAIDSNSMNSPRWGLLRSRLDGHDLDTITLFSTRHAPVPFESEFFQVEGIERLPVNGRFLVGCSTWCSPNQLKSQERRLQKAVGGWVSAQAAFYDRAGAILKESIKAAGQDTSTTSTQATSQEKEPDRISRNAQMLRKKL